MNAIDHIQKKYLKNDIPSFKAGDTVKVHVKIVEGEKQRIQIFEGLVIKIRGGGTAASFTVRKISYGVGVERVFPFHAPTVEKIEVVRRGRVRRAKLYYLRDLSGKKARIRELDRNKLQAIEEKEAKAKKLSKTEEAKETPSKPETKEAPVAAEKAPKDEGTQNNDAAPAAKPAKTEEKKPTEKKPEASKKE